MFDRLKQLGRRFWNSTLANPAKWFTDAVGGTKSVSGETVNEKTALGLSAYLACIKNISEDIAKMPCSIYERMDPRGRKQQTSHPVHRLLHDEANEEMSAMTFRETLTQHCLGWKGGFAEIVRNGAGQPAALYPLDPTTVQVCRDKTTRVLFYMVDNKPMQASDIFHIHGLGYDGLTGYVISQVAKDVVGNALAAQKFAGSFFANGTVASGVITVPDAMTETAFKHLRESFQQRYGGSGNQHKPVILEQGATWSQTSSEPQKAQMVEVLQQGVEEVCRLFRMPPHKVQHLLRSTFSNIEMQAIEYVTDCLLGWAVRWEQEVNRKLLLPRERVKLFAKHNFNMLLRGDQTARSAFYREMFNIGALSDNDIRELEDQNPVEGGDTYFVNAAMIPLDIASTGKHIATLQPKPEPTPPGDNPNDNSPPDPRSNPDRPDASNEHKRELLGRVAAAHTKQLEAAIAGVLRVEHDKVKRAAKRPDFKQWASDFYGKSHKAEVCDRLKPVLGSLSTSLRAVLEK